MKQNKFINKALIYIIGSLSLVVFKKNKIRANFHLFVCLDSYSHPNFKVKMSLLFCFFYFLNLDQT